MNRCVKLSFLALLSIGINFQVIGASDADETADVLGSIIQMIESGELETAAASLQEIPSQHQHDPDVLIVMGYLSHETGELGDAARYYAEALDLEPQHPGALARQGLLFLASNREARARANLEQLVSVCGRTCPEFNFLAAALRDYDGE